MEPSQTNNPTRGHIIYKKPYRTIRKIAEEEELPRRVTKMASLLLATFLKMNSRHVRNRAYYAAAALIVVARREGHLIAIEEMRRTLNCLGYPCKGHTLAKKVGELSSSLGIQESLDLREYVAYILRRLALDENVMLRLRNNGSRRAWEVLSRIELRALRLMRSIRANRVCRLQLLGKNPLTLSAALVYVVARRLGIREITQAGLAKAAYSHKTVVRKRAKMLEELLRVEQ